MIRPLRFAIETAAFDLVLGLSRVLPRRALLAAGAALGRLLGRIDRRHARIARANLDLALGGETSEGDRRRILASAWAHFGRIAADAVALPRLVAPGPSDRVRVDGIEHLRGAFAAGRGVLVFSGHFGHWELAAAMQGRLGFPMALVARPLDNPRLEERLARLRGASGNSTLDKRRALREMILALRRGLGVAILIDQDARDGGVFVPFFGVPASTTPSLALLALRTGAPILPVFCVPEPGGRYRIVYEPVVPVASTGDRDADVLRVTAECSAILERWVRRFPEYWLWMHRRFKSSPPGRADQDVSKESA